MNRPDCYQPETIVAGRDSHPLERGAFHGARGSRANVFLAGKPRLVAKLHRPWPGGVRPPCGPTPLSFQGASRLRRRPSRRQAVTMWTRPADRASSYGACGQALEKLALPHRLPTLDALAPTSSPLLQRRFIRKATAPASVGSRIAPSSHAIRLRNNPVKSRGDPTGESEKQQRGSRTRTRRAPARRGRCRCCATPPACAS